MHRTIWMIFHLILIVIFRICHLQRVLRTMKRNASERYYGRYHICAIIRIICIGIYGMMCMKIGHFIPNKIDKVLRGNECCSHIRNGLSTKQDERKMKNTHAHRNTNPKPSAQTKIHTILCMHACVHEWIWCLVCCWFWFWYCFDFGGFVLFEFEFHVIWLHFILEWYFLQ